MGGTLANIYNNVGLALNLHAEAMAQLQEQVSTGSRINRASDDPSAAYRVLGLDSEQRLLEGYMDNISNAVGTLGLSSMVVGNMLSNISEEKVHLTQIVGGTYTQQERNSLAGGINDTLEQMVSLANTRHIDQYLFGGSSTSSAPYVVQRNDDGEIASVVYQGSDEQLQVQLARGVESSSFYVGDNIFCSDSRSTPVFSGDTGVKAGTATSSVRGDIWLTVTDEDENGTYELSIDGGLTSVDEDGTANQAIIDSRTERVLYVNTTGGINGTGVEMVRVPGTYDVFNMLISIRDILRNEKAFSDSRVVELVNNSIASMEEVRNLLVGKQVSIGSKIGFLNNLESTLERIKFDTEEEAVTLQQADITQIAIDLSRREVLYQMSLAVAGRLMSISLLDFIR